MSQSIPLGLFVTGTDTGVGKTHVAAMIARSLAAAGHRVGVYKPVASGCRREGDRLVSDDAVELWEAADRPLALEQVCPQRFEAPLAPHRAAEAEGRAVDERLLVTAFAVWCDSCDMVIVEGAGGLLSPLSQRWSSADLAAELALPLVIVARNALGTIHQTLATLAAARSHRGGLPVAGVVLNQPLAETDASSTTNADDLRRRMDVPLLAQVRHGQSAFEPAVDWFALPQTR